MTARPASPVPPAVVLAGAALAAALFAAPTVAQDDIIARCRATTATDAERAACLEAFIRGESPAGPAAQGAAVQEAPTPAPEAVQGTADETGGRSFFRLPRLPFSAQAPSDAPAIAQASPEADELVDEEEFGAERMASRERREEPRMTASVVDSTVVPYKRLEVELDNGQVWRQSQSGEHWNGDGVSEPEDVEIWSTRFGGYRMLLVEQDVTLQVQRVR